RSCLVAMEPQKMEAQTEGCGKPLIHGNLRQSSIILPIAYFRNYIKISLYYLLKNKYPYHGLLLIGIFIRNGLKRYLIRVLYLINFDAQLTLDIMTFERYQE